MSDIKNPWGLTERESGILDAVCEKGNRKAAEVRFGLSSGAVKDHIERIRRKMDSPYGDHLLYVLKWDRWRREQENYRKLSEERIEQTVKLAEDWHAIG